MGLDSRLRGNDDKRGADFVGEDLTQDAVKRFGLKEDRAAMAFLVALAALYFLPVLLEGNSRVLSQAGTDTWRQFFYWRHFGFSRLASGEIPLWNPYIFSGTPFVDGMQSAIFYPLNVLFLLFETGFAINLSVALHCFLASLFTYLFARYMDLGRPAAVLSAITFAYGAPYFLHIYPGHLSNLSTMVWLPLIFMGIEAFLRHRKIRYAVLSGIPLAMQVFAGHAQYLFYSAIAVSLYFLLSLLFSKPFAKAPYYLAGFCLFALTGVALSAAQLVPTLELGKYSVREALSYDWVSLFSLPPENLATLLLPNLFGDLLGVPYWGKNYLWEMSVYLGVIPLAMVAAAMIFDRSKPVWIFSSIALVVLILALGKHTPLLGLLYAYVPGFNLFRGLSKFVFVFSFACSMLAGYGLDRLTAPAEEETLKRRRFSQGLLAVAVLFGLVGVVVLLQGPEWWGSLVSVYDRGREAQSPVWPTDDFFHASMSAAVRDLFKAAVLLLLLGGLLFFFGKIKRLSVNASIVSLLALTAIDLWSFGSRYLPTFSPEILSMDRGLKAFLAKDKEPYRVATPLRALLNVGLLEGIENVGGYDAIVLRSYSEFINFTQRLPLDEPNIVMGIDRYSPLLNLLNVKYYILESTVSVQLPNWEPVFQGNGYKVYRDSLALPRSFIVHDAIVMKGGETIFQEMTRPTFDPTSVAIVEDAIDGLPRDQTLRSPAPKIVEHSPRKVLLEADSRDAGLLVLADAYYPGWKAFVDGKEAGIVRANHTMRGVFLSKGRHRVEFRYDPLSFKIGAIVSLLSLVLVAGFLFWFRIENLIFSAARGRRVS